MVARAETIDMTPKMLKSAEGRKLVHAASMKLDTAIGNVAHAVALHLDDMEHETGFERQSAFAAMKLAVSRWHEAGSDFAFTLGGVNPETRERYNFAPDAESTNRSTFTFELSEAAAAVVGAIIGNTSFYGNKRFTEEALSWCQKPGQTAGHVDLELHHLCDAIRARGLYRPNVSSYDGPVAGASAQDGPGSGLSASQGHDPALGRQEDARTGGAAAGASVALFAGAGAGGECPEGPGTPLDAPQGDDPARVDDPWLRGYRAGLKAGDSERARV
jgi:hypothetical protein